MILSMYLVQCETDLSILLPAVNVTFTFNKEDATGRWRTP